METDDRFREREHGQQPVEEDETVSFGVSPVRYVDVEELSENLSIRPIGMRPPSRSRSTNSNASSNSFLPRTSSTSSEAEGSPQMISARASTRLSSQSFGESTVADLPPQFLEASISRKQGWLPFPPAKPSNKDDLNPSDNFPSSSPSNLSQNSDGQKFSSDFSSSHAGARSTPSPRTKTYELKVKKLYYKLPPPKQTALTKLRKFFTGTPKIDDDYATNGRYILRNITFEAKVGEVLGIAGASGAGKSTILECLAGRVKPSSPPGCILVNNQVMSASTFRRISGYVMQDDALFPTLTVIETLLFSAKLRLPSTMSTAEKKLRVQRLLCELGLQHAANTRIGNEMIRGVSGGERRRVSIGIDVIHDPAVLILDEPTSGLDSAAALNVIAMLRAMALFRGRTVVLSIHQPSFRILQLMQSVLLVAGGMVVHHGSLEHLASRLASAGHEVPARTTVLEYAIDAVNSWETEDSYAAVAKGLTQQQMLMLDKDNYRRPSEARLVDDVETGAGLSNGVSHDGNSGSPGDDCNKDDKISYSNNVLQETAVLTERFFKNILRTKELFGARSIQALLAGVILGTVFLNVSNDRQGVSDRLGFFLFTLSFLLNSTTEALPIFLQERQILLRETSRGAYRISSYVLSNTVVFVPFLFTIAILYGTPSYWLAGLTSSIGCFLFYCLVLWLTLVLANSFVAFFSALVPNYIMGQALIAAFMGAFFLFSGYIINRNSIPKYWIWMHYISLFKYPFDALLLNEFGSHRSSCYDRISSDAAWGGSAGMCTLTGSQVLENSGVQGHRKWMDVAAMVGFILFYRINSYGAVRWRLNRHQR